jgi:hypothetical protein
MLMLGGGSFLDPPPLCCDSTRGEDGADGSESSRPDEFAEQEAYAGFTPGSPYRAQWPVGQ